jgi:hypothetical protein
MKIQRTQPQQALQEINESGLVETVRQPYNQFKKRFWKH